MAWPSPELSPRNSGVSVRTGRYPRVGDRPCAGIADSTLGLADRLLLSPCTCCCRVLPERKPHMLRIGSLELATPLLLAPIAGYCDLAFRLLVRGLRGPSGGVGLASTELLCSDAISRCDPVHGPGRAARRLSTWRRRVPRIGRCACSSMAMMRVFSPTPAPGPGPGRRPDRHQHGLPGGQDHQDPWRGEIALRSAAYGGPGQAGGERGEYPRHRQGPPGLGRRRHRRAELAPALVDVGIAAITVHGRTAGQRFSGLVGLEGIAATVAAMQRHPRVPVIGNGDIKTPHDARQMLDATGCQGVMIGRGALGQPWIFRDTAHYLATGTLLEPLTQAQSRPDRAGAF